MNTPAGSPTLGEDWQERRALLMQSRASPREYAEIQLRVLDYLLDRYAEEPETAGPAKFPLCTDVYFNERAVLVHHHLSKYVDSGVQSAEEAQQRVSSVLQRLAADQAAEYDDEDSAASDEVEFSARGPIREAKQLFERIRKQGDLSAVAGLLGCDARYAANYAALAWRDCVVERSFTGLESKLRAVLGHPMWREHALFHIRLLLADSHTRVRREAARLLGEIGGLDDVGLLMDLLALPKSPDEDPQEREAIVLAIKRISGQEDREPASTSLGNVRSPLAKPLPMRRGLLQAFLILALFVVFCGLPGLCVLTAFWTSPESHPEFFGVGVVLFALGVGYGVKLFRGRRGG